MSDQAGHLNGGILFESFFEDALDGAVVIDVRLSIIRTNLCAQALLGCTAGELIGQGVETLLPESSRYLRPLLSPRRTLHPQAGPFNLRFETSVRLKDGQEAPVEVTLNSIVEIDGNRLALVILRDITAQQSAKQDNPLARINTPNQFEEIIGRSGTLKPVFKQVETVAPTSTTVLILGETGTGKDMIARAIHNLSPRRSRSFVKLNCAAIPTGLLESELFGHEKGAFTGSIGRGIGRLEFSNGGTLFLDEIGDVPLELQPKLLRAIQEKEFERLGSTRTIPVDVRFIAATNRNLPVMIKDGLFRNDLFYRLNVFPIKMPALRERVGDVPLLIQHLIKKYNQRLGKHVEAVLPEDMEALTAWHWPGNIRELENLIERAVLLSEGTVLRVQLAELEAAPEQTPYVPAASLNLKDVEREHIVRVVRETKGRIAGPEGAAAKLGMKRTTLTSKMRRLGISAKAL